MPHHGEHEAEDGKSNPGADVYLRRILLSQHLVEGSLAGRHRCSPQAGGGRGDCTRSYMGWTLTTTAELVLLRIDLLQKNSTKFSDVFG